MLTGTARAQTIDTPSPSDRGWRTRIELQVDAEYDDNVFLLAPTRKPDLASPSAGDVTSGRFRGMESAGDVITDLGLGIAFRGPGLTGRTLAIVPSVGYEWYAQSPERSNLTLGLAMEQALPHQDMVRLRGGIVPSYFQKNYLSDAVDVSGDGVITNDERIYARGEYRETSAGIDYRHRLVKETSSRSTSLWLTVGGAYSSKRFDAPHQGRDLSGPTASIGLKMDRGKAFSVQVAYSQDWLDATADSQVMVLDEPDFGQDLNGNTTTTDLDVRVAGTVDRSRVERAGGARVDIAVGRRSELRLDYEHRWRSFSSTEPLDAANRGRRDRRDQFGATFVSELSRRVRMHVGAQRGAQRLDRLIGTAGAGDVDDYTRTQIQVGLTCTCLSTRGRR
ncbi:MAG: hypothetical protein ABIQ41_03885 [Gemmatimonadales bacterium]